MTNQQSNQIQTLFRQSSISRPLLQFILNSREDVKFSQARGLCSRIYKIPTKYENDDSKFENSSGELCIKRVEEDDQYAPHSIEREILAYKIISERKGENGDRFIMSLLAAFKNETDDFNTLFDLVMPWYPCTLQELLNEPSLQFISPESIETDQEDERHSAQIAKSIGCLTKFSNQVSFQLFSALEFIHQNGIAHRDIKPSNILLKQDGSNDIQLIDFGTCFLSEERYSLGDDGKGGLASEVGTGSYRAPECLLSPLNGYDPFKVDIWQAGVTLSEFFLPLKKVTKCVKNDTRENMEDKDDKLDWERALWSKDDGKQFEELCNHFDQIQGHSEDFFTIEAEDDSREDIGSGWERQSLFEGGSGDLGLANSIFNILGLPNGDSEGEILWPEAIHFQPSLARLPFKRRHPIEGGLKYHLLHFLPEDVAKILNNLADVLEGCVQLSAGRRINAKLAVDRLSPIM